MLLDLLIDYRLLIDTLYYIAYIYIERERLREREIDSLYICIDIYIILLIDFTINPYSTY